jgi:hypothetical protein
MSACETRRGERVGVRATAISILCANVPKKNASDGPEMSAFGTFQTFRTAIPMSAFGGKADVLCLSLAL